MTLTIITINYNNAVGLQKTMESVLTQTSRDFEYIVIDGGVAPLNPPEGGTSRPIQQDIEVIEKFIAEKGQKIGTLYRNNDAWIFEYYDNGKLISEILNIKF